jgi:hypothetical protein
MSEELAPAAQAAYEAYALAVGGRDPYQHPMEPYSDLHDVYKAAWEQAAHAALVYGKDFVPVVDAPAHGPAPGPPPAPKADAEDEDGEPRPRGGRRA